MKSKLKITPAQEPVDLVPASAPTSAPAPVDVTLGEALNMSEASKTPFNPVDLPVVSSKDNNKFRVIGQSDSGIQLSIRFWKDMCESGSSSLGYRLRFGDRKDNPVIETVEWRAIGPINEYWTGGTGVSEHRSVQGALTVPGSPWDVIAVLHSLAVNGYVDMILDAIVVSAPSIKLNISREEFHKLVALEVVNALDGCYRPKEKPPLSVLTLGYAQAPLIHVRDGKVMPPPAPKVAAKQSAKSDKATAADVGL